MSDVQTLPSSQGDDAFEEGMLDCGHSASRCAVRCFYCGLDACENCSDAFSEPDKWGRVMCPECEETFAV